MEGDEELSSTAMEVTDSDVASSGNITIMTLGGEDIVRVASSEDMIGTLTADDVVQVATSADMTCGNIDDGSMVVSTAGMVNESGMEPQPPSSVVQVIMQEDGQIIMPEGQFIHLNTDDQTQYIQLTGDDGENQFIQLTADGSAQLIHVNNDQDTAPHFIQVSESGVLAEHTLQEDTSVVQATDVSQYFNTPQQEPVIETALLMPSELSSAGNEEMLQQVNSEHDSIVQQTSDTGGMEVIQLKMEQDDTENTMVSMVTLPEASICDTPTSSSLCITSVASLTDTVATTKATTAPMKSQEAKPTKAPPPPKVVDMSQPIKLTSETLVSIAGKQCVLRVDPDTSHLVAYPVRPESSGRKRGRPRKIRTEDGQPAAAASSGGTTSQASTSGQDETSQSGDNIENGDKRDLSEQENSAAEGLLGLSDAEGVRRSNRKRKKARFLYDYETGVIEGVDEGEEEPDAGEQDIEAKRRGRPPKQQQSPMIMTATKNTMQTLLANMGYPVKRGRGRPRRRPLPGNMPGPIPAFIIPSPGGQAVMMAPVQNMTQLDAMKRNQGLITIRPKVDSTVTNENPPIIIQNTDGTQTQIMQQSPLQQQPITIATSSGAPTTLIELKSDQNVDTDLTKGKPEASEGETNQVDALDTVTDGLKLNDSDNNEEEDEDSKANLDIQDKISDNESVTDPAAVLQVETNLAPAAIVQLPQDLVPLLIPKKEPVKIGLKASESDLEKLKCDKCDFQAYYQQQYQEHLATHSEDLHKCKCCPFLSFSADDILKHFREAHPRCICTDCDFMAEHAYVVKRHMMRHRLEGSECEICGKKYKDQYILKMHIKMVHMPAEVLYGCDICAKKFTRKAHLKRHLRIHEPEKPFKCPHCDYRGCERSDITKHVLIHDDPRHVCEVCGKAFRHIKNKELHVKRHKGQRDYKCGVCDFYGYTFTDIRKHIERKHSDAKNILCDKCGAAFKNDILLKEHQREQCELMMIEQALAISQSEGHAIHIPATQLSTDGNSILVDGNQVNITVEQVALSGELSSWDEPDVVSAGEVDDDDVSVCLPGENHIIYHQHMQMAVAPNQLGVESEIGAEDVLDGGKVEMTTPGTVIMQHVGSELGEDETMHVQMVDMNSVQVGEVEMGHHDDDDDDDASKDVPMEHDVITTLHPDEHNEYVTTQDEKNLTTEVISVEDGLITISECS